MNPTKRILFLSAFVSAILLFWLMPRINKASQVEYKRPVKNKEVPKLRKVSADNWFARKDVINEIPKKERKPDPVEKPVKAEFKNEKNKSGKRELNIKFRPKLYGRGMPFYEEEIPFDSTESAPVDSSSVKVF